MRGQGRHVTVMRALAWDPIRDRFHLVEEPLPHPGPTDVLVRVEACGLNPVDAKIYQWRTMAPAMRAGWVVGLDVSGWVAAVGREVTGWKVGDRVLYHGDMMRPHGGLADFALHDHRALLKHPDLPAEVAAASPCAGWTAWRALVDKLDVRDKSSLLIAGGSGGVGSFAVQIARHLGVPQIIATSSAPIMAMSASLARQRSSTGARARCGRSDPGAHRRRLGVAAALDTVGGDNDIFRADLLAFEGSMVELVGTVRPDAYRDAFMRALSFHQLSLGAGLRNGRAGLKRLLDAGAPGLETAGGGRDRRSAPRDPHARRCRHGADRDAIPADRRQA